MTDYIRDLDEVVRLARLATPGEWRAENSVGEWAIRTSDGRYVGGLMKGNRECAASASLIANLVNYIRQHHAAIRRDAEELRIRRLELQHERAKNERLVQILTGIHALLYPERQEVGGKVFEFKAPNPHRFMQELSDRIRAIPAAIAKESGNV